jgi:uncharacterized membrane protein (UPF0127 family)
MRFRAIVIFSLVVLLAGCGGTGADQGSGSRENSRPSAAKSAGSKATTSESPDLPAVIIDASGGEKVEVRVEIADDFFERQRGLMYRKALGEDRGMLFVFPREQPVSFWMKNTRIPLSIAYIDSKGRITDLLNMKPLDDKPPHYVSSEPIQYALEVNQGFFEEQGVRVGDHVELLT